MNNGWIEFSPSSRKKSRLQKGISSITLFSFEGMFRDERGRRLSRIIISSISQQVDISNNDNNNWETKHPAFHPSLTLFSFFSIQINQIITNSERKNRLIIMKIIRQINVKLPPLPSPLSSPLSCHPIKHPLIRWYSWRRKNKKRFLSSHTLNLMMIQQWTNEEQINNNAFLMLPCSNIHQG